MLAVLGACGRQTISAEGSLARIDLAPAPGAAPWPQPTTVLRLPASQGWTGLAPEVGRPGPGGAKLSLADPRGRHVLVASLGFDRSPPAFTQLLVEARAFAPGMLSAEFYRGDQLVGASAVVPLVVSDQVQPLELAASTAYLHRQDFDRLLIKASATVRKLELVGVDLVRRPPQAWVPDPAGEPALLSCQGEARLAEGLSSDSPLEADPTLPAGARLVFSRAWPLGCRKPGQQPRLHVRVTAGEASVEQRFAFAEGTPRWEEATIDLSALGERTVRLVVSLDPGNPDRGSDSAACALGELRVVMPGSAPSTVVLITSDTHRADHLACAPGAVSLLTPNLDALAARGVLFTDCESVTNVTNPSHVAILTGVHPAETGIQHNSLPLRRSARTLAEAFAAAGFHTLAVVSARHLGDQGSGLGQGFDRMSWPETGGLRTADVSVRRALSWLDQSADEPTFLWLHLFDAHGPYKPPDRWRRQYWPAGRDPFDQALPPPELDPSVLPPELSGLRELSFPAAAYKGEVSFLDEQLAPLLARGRVRRGVVVFTADHGESLGQHGIWFTHAGLYPDSVHVPLVMSFPGCVQGSVVDQPVGHLDLAATLLSLGGVSRHDLPGRSFEALARGGGFETGPRFALSAHAFSAAVTDAGWHLILHLRAQAQRQMTHPFERHQVELYDLIRDPGCEHDLVGSEPTRAKRLRAGLLAWLGSRQDRGWAGRAIQDPERLAQLAALGYVDAEQEAGGDLWQPDRCPRCLPFLEEGGDDGESGR